MGAQWGHDGGTMGWTGAKSLFSRYSVAIQSPFSRHSVAIQSLFSRYCDPPKAAAAAAVYPGPPSLSARRSHSIGPGRFPPSLTKSSNSRRTSATAEGTARQPQSMFGRRDGGKLGVTRLRDRSRPLADLAAGCWLLAAKPALGLFLAGLLASPGFIMSGLGARSPHYDRTGCLALGLPAHHQSSQPYAAPDSPGLLTTAWGSTKTGLAWELRPPVR
ncbi:hypothetical protein AOQ84DRAFT_220917 [Glonium stellatum]|uniref:Uncharacterized protein n=1 Tax=Glonium stellatum TaxID=574774 RepID=A0A8E2F2R8_9PEZI|nr:hypothetical protein AOQ84DRAFT_220917 [Glonium stellatum]